MAIIDIPWQQPVSVKLQNGSTRLFRGAYDALDFLENEWPVRKGHHYQNTISLCRSALNRSISTEVAREAFLASCLEAGMAWNISGICQPALAGRVNQASA
jgi:hypothetical protein